MADEKKWLTVSEVAEILSTSTETVRRKIAAGELLASRASAAPRAAYLIDAAAFESQRESERQRAAVRQRLAGVVTTRGEISEALAREHPDVRVGSAEGPTLAEYTRKL